MRLLHTETGRFYYTYLPVRGSYAILSHAETTRNTTYQQMLSIQARTTEGTALEDDELEDDIIDEDDELQQEVQTLETFMSNLDL